MVNNKKPWNIDEVEAITRLSATIQSMSTTSQQLGVKVGNLKWGSGTAPNSTAPTYTSTKGNYTPWSPVISSSRHEERTYFMGGPLEGTWRMLIPLEDYCPSLNTFYRYTATVKDNHGEYRIMLYHRGR